MAERGLVLIHTPYAGDRGMFEAAPGSGLSIPWAAARERLRGLGWELDTAWSRPGEVRGARWNLFFNAPAGMAAGGGALRRALGALRRRLRPRPEDAWRALNAADLRERAALFLWEPPVVQPENYEPALHARFNRVFTWDAALLASGRGYRPLFTPMAEGQPEPAAVPYAGRKLLVNFSGNKSSGHPLELYGARASMIRHMQAAAPGDFDHYGPGWEGWPLWRGVAPDKLALYPRYRFALCYENMRDTPGYLTEKLFDALLGGCVPVYWGDPGLASEVDPLAWLDRAAFPSDAALHQALAAMGEDEWARRRQAGQDWLRSEARRRRGPDAFADLLVRELDLG